MYYGEDLVLSSITNGVTSKVGVSMFFHRLNIASVSLGLIQAFVCPLDELSGLANVIILNGGQAKAYAHVYADTVPAGSICAGRIDPEKVFGCLSPDFVHDHKGLVKKSIGEQDTEFIPAVAGYDVCLSQLAAKEKPQAFQGTVSCRMAIGVIDKLEAINIEHTAGQGLAVSFGTFKLCAESMAQIAAVIESSQWVTTDQPVEALDL